MKTILVSFIILFGLSFAATGQDFTAMLDEVVTNPSDPGNAIHARDVVYMKNGNLAIDLVRSLPSPHIMRTVHMANGDFVMAYLATVGSPLAVRSSYKVSLPLGVLPTVESNCLSFADNSIAPFDVKVGEKVGEIQTMKTVLHENGDTITTWRAPSLGCIVVQQEVEFLTGGKSVKTLSHLDQVTPIADSVFNPAAPEMRPSEARSAYLSWADRQSGKPCTNCEAVAIAADAIWLKEHGH
jgi:hypothetical protein